MDQGDDTPGTKTRVPSSDNSAMTSAPEDDHAHLEKARTKEQQEQDLFRALSRRRTSATGHGHQDGDGANDEEHHEIDRLMSRMFGQARREKNDEHETRHSGVVFRHLTVKGVGLGASLQPTVGDIFMGLPRALGKLFSRGTPAVAKPPVRELLSDFDGCVRPGELLLVLGRPGAGCTTFLKVFANQRSGFEAVEGDMTYGGTGSDEMAKRFRGDVIYNPEDDLHYAKLSVRQTLSFALQTRTPGKEARLDGESRADYISEFLRIVTKLFWIEHTLDTRVGDEFVRGVSGGERKRVSIAEAMITRASVQAWDNSSKGLDASTALEYVRSIRAMTNMAEASTAVSLYQAGESLYELADKVLLIDEGKCLYFGPTDQAKQYFIDLGFDCPDRWTTPDFLTSVSDEHERTIRPGWESRIPRSPEAFSRLYRDSDAYRRNLADVDDFEAQLRRQQEARGGASDASNQKDMNYTLPFHQQVMACTRRQFLIMIGDRAALFGKWGGLVFQGLIVGSSFYGQGDGTTSAFARGGALFVLLLFNALLALAEQTAAFEAKPILLKHKSFSFYRPAAYAIAQVFVDVPLVLIQVLIFNIIIYFMAGLSASASQFFISTLILWMVTMTTYSYFRTISAWCATLDLATRFTGISIQVLVVYTGYLIPPKSMHPWFSWLRWINWMQYGFECLMANEFAFREMECQSPQLVPVGPNARAPYQSCTLKGSTKGSTSVSGADYIDASFNYSRSHLWRNFGILWAFFFLFVLLTVLGMDFMKPNAGGGAITVFKRGQVPKKVEQTIEAGGKGGNAGATDEESGTPNKIAVADGAADRHASDKEKPVQQQVAKNETVFTFRDVNYTIPFKGGERKLLQGVQGYVRPGKLTALMGASGKLNGIDTHTNSTCKSWEHMADRSTQRFRCRKDDPSQHPRAADQLWRRHW